MECARDCSVVHMSPELGQELAGGEMMRLTLSQGYISICHES